MYKCRLILFQYAIMEIMSSTFKRKKAYLFKVWLTHTCSFSHTFFFGLSLSSGLPFSYPSTKTCSPGEDPSGGSRGSTLLGSPSLEINRPKKKAINFFEREMSLRDAACVQNTNDTHIEAHSSMAWDSIPRIFWGFRLHSTNTILSCRSSCEI